jgi:hypothetical protein
MNQKSTDAIMCDPEFRRLCRNVDRLLWKRGQARLSTRSGYKVFTFSTPALAYAAEVQGLQTVFIIRT